MSTNQRKKVTLEFISDDQLYKGISLESENNPIAIRTRSRSKCSSASKSKDRTFTPTAPKPKWIRKSTPISNSVQSLEKTPSPKRTRSATKRSSRKTDETDECSPFISKIPKPGCSSQNGKVTPLKINTKSLSGNRTPSDDSSPEEKTPKVVLSRSPYVKELQSSEDVFRSSPRKRNTSQKEKEPASLVDKCRTPRTPRLLNGNSTVTPGRTGSANRTLRNLSATPGTPKSRRTLKFSENDVVPSTPMTTRRQLKKRIQTMTKIDEDEFEEDDFERLDSDNSEYSDIQSDSEYEEIESDASYEGTPVKRTRLHTLQKSIVSSPSTSYCITPTKTIVHQKMVTLDSEKYFEKKSTKSIISTNVLSELPLPEISESDLSEIASKKYVKHPHEIKQLTLKYKEQFNKWLLYLKEGFNLMLYGVGSKLEILKEFYNEKLDNSLVLRVNGFNSNFSMNEMIRALTKDILQMNRCPANINEALNLAASELKLNQMHVFIIINNIDGVALRGNKKQNMLSKLAELPNIHIVATLDHVNAPLLWGNNKMSSFNFVWLDVTTYNSYATEISYQKSMGIDNLSSDSSLMTLNQLFKWQDQRTKEVFELIVKDYLDNKHKKNFKGILTTDLSRSALKSLSISSNSALMFTLKTFIDHDIICIEHNYLKFLINPNILRTFYNQHFNK